MRAVGFADDDSMPARDLSTGERLPPSLGSAQENGDQRRGPRGPVDLADAAQRVAPLTLARARRLDVSPTMAAVLPEGLQRGTTVGVRGATALSLALATAAGPMATGSWLAVVGCGDLCPAGAAALGVALHRTVVVDEPPRGSWGSVLAALFDAFDIVIVDRASSGLRSDGPPIAHRDLGRLAARARERGTVIIDVADVWPAAPDIGIEVVAQQWSGLGDGHGVLAGRNLIVEVSGRRDAGRPRRVELSLPGADGALAAYAGADIDALVDADLDLAAGVQDLDGDVPRPGVNGEAAEPCVQVLRRVG